MKPDLTNPDTANKVHPLTEEEAAFFQDRIEFAKQIPAFRKALGMTVKDLAEESGLSIDTVIAIENFRHPASDEEMSLLKLALDIK